MPLSFQCFNWQALLQYSTALNRLHLLSLASSQSFWMAQLLAHTLKPAACGGGLLWNGWLV